MNGYTDVVDTLIVAGAKINMQDLNGNTALILGLTLEIKFL